MRFEVAVQDALGVDIGNPIDDLLDDDLNPLLIDLVLLVGDELLQVLLVVVKHDLQGLLLGLVEDLE